MRWVLDEERITHARDLYRAVLRVDEPIVAPRLVPQEVTTVLRQRVRVADGLSLTIAFGHLADFLALPIECHTPAGLDRRALALADACSRRATYDDE